MYEYRKMTPEERQIVLDERHEDFLITPPRISRELKENI